MEVSLFRACAEPLGPWYIDYVRYVINISEYVCRKRCTISSISVHNWQRMYFEHEIHMWSLSSRKKLRAVLALTSLEGGSQT
jgi:hypothetical protein